MYMMQPCDEVCIIQNGFPTIKVLAVCLSTFMENTYSICTVCIDKFLKAPLYKFTLNSVTTTYPYSAQIPAYRTVYN